MDHKLGVKAGGGDGGEGGGGGGVPCLLTFTGVGSLARWWSED